MSPGLGVRAPTILWVDDERYALTSLKSLVEAKGFRVLCAYDLAEALTMLAAHQHEIGPDPLERTRGLGRSR